MEVGIEHFINDYLPPLMLKMAKKKEKLSYGKWKPCITPEKAFSDSVRLTGLRAVGENLYWLEGRPQEGGRIVLVKGDTTGAQADITPKGFYVRNRVHEYGGAAHTIHGDHVFFVNFKDQRIYRQNRISGGVPVPLTPEKFQGDFKGKYAALDASPDGKTLVCVFEKEHKDPSKTENSIATIDLTQDGIVDPFLQVSGNDFYSDPKFSPDGKKIAWVTWNHPNMPWDSTELYVGNFDGRRIVPGTEKKVVGGDRISVCQPHFDENGKLYFVMDTSGQPEDSPSNWWNIYRYDKGNIEAITAEMAEFGSAQWAFGMSNFTFLPGGNIAATFFKEGKNYLSIINPETKDFTVLDTPWEAFGGLNADKNGSLYASVCNPQELLSLVKMDMPSLKPDVVKKSSTISLNPEDISVAEMIKYPTSDGGFAHAYLYYPKNSKYEAPKGEKPPLIVRAHGGPTSSTSGSMLSLTMQFWTSQGYAILDVDYRGSDGYGRKYRDALLGKWGVIDAQDIVDGVRYLVKEGIVQEGKVAITGGSAGGYAVQRALTMFPDDFQVGASYFGIGNLETMTKLTHKFESRYLENLIGQPWPEGNAEYKERSPVNHLDKLKSPMILLQGSEDKIVPPEVSREMKQILDAKGLKCEYVEYEGEAHGFRSKENNVDALNKEAAFFRAVLYGAK